MWEKLRNLWKAPEGMGAHTAHESSRFGVSMVGWMAVPLVIVVLWIALSWVDPENKLFAAVVAMRIDIARLPIAVLKFALALAVVAFAFQIIENSHMGQRISQRWEGGKAAIYAALLVGACIVLGGK